MNLRKVAAGFGLMAAVVSWTAMAQSKPWDLDTVLHQMDVSSANFKSAQADVKKDMYERVVKDTTTQTGTVYYQRVGRGFSSGRSLRRRGRRSSR